MPRKADSSPASDKSAKAVSKSTFFFPNVGNGVTIEAESYEKAEKLASKLAADLAGTSPSPSVDGK